MKRTDSNCDLVLDCEAPLSRTIPFYPASAAFRSTLKATPADNQEIIGQVGGEIPGHRLLVNTKARSVTVIDRMGLPENEWKIEKIKDLAKHEHYWWASEELLGPLGVEKDIEFHNLTHKKWLQWLYFLRKHVDNGRMVVVKGQLPSIVEILGMCDHKNGLRIQIGDSCGARLEDMDRAFWFVDERDIHAMEMAGVED